MSIDKVRLLLKHRLGLTMPARDHESFSTGSTRHGTTYRHTLSCAAYIRQHGPARSHVAGRFTWSMAQGYFHD